MHKLLRLLALSAVALISFEMHAMQECKPGAVKVRFFNESKTPYFILVSHRAGRNPICLKRYERSEALVLEPESQIYISSLERIYGLEKRFRHQHDDDVYLKLISYNKTEWADGTGVIVQKIKSTNAFVVFSKDDQVHLLDGGSQSKL